MNADEREAKMAEMDARAHRLDTQFNQTFGSIYAKVADGSAAIIGHTTPASVVSFLKSLLSRQGWIIHEVDGKEDLHEDLTVSTILMTADAPEALVEDVAKNVNGNCKLVLVEDGQPASNRLTTIKNLFPNANVLCNPDRFMELAATVKA